MGFLVFVLYTVKSESPGCVCSKRSGEVVKSSSGGVHAPLRGSVVLPVRWVSPPRRHRDPISSESGAAVPMDPTTAVVPANDSGAWNWTAPNESSSVPCTNDYCISDEEYVDRIKEYIYPSALEWVFIALHCTVFIVGLVGNFLVCLAVYRNHNMRTVTNYFIVNLAVADFLIILVCLPPTVLWDVTETWFLGQALCKTVLYLQAVSVSVSVLTLTFISVDRWYAICYPLKFNSTTNRAKVAIFIIWLVSMLLVMPELVVNTTKPAEQLAVATHYFMDCSATWSDQSQKTYQIILLVFLYILPFLLMSVAYQQIVKVLWNDNIPGHSESEVIVCKSVSTKFARPNCSSNGQIRSRRKAAKMLIAIVVMFGVCYFPVHLLNVLRYFIELPQNDFLGSASLLAHWLCYANSAMNPVIYNFMSGKFRKEFVKAFSCCCRSSVRLGGGRSGRGTTATYSCKYTSTSTHVDTLHLNSITP